MVSYPSEVGIIPEEDFKKPTLLSFSLIKVGIFIPERILRPYPMKQKTLRGGYYTKKLFDLTETQYNRIEMRKIM